MVHWRLAKPSTSETTERESVENIETGSTSTLLVDLCKRVNVCQNESCLLIMVYCGPRRRKQSTTIHVISWNGESLVGIYFWDDCQYLPCAVCPLWYTKRWRVCVWTTTTHLLLYVGAFILPAIEVIKQIVTDASPKSCDLDPAPAYERIGWRTSSNVINNNYNVLMFIYPLVCCLRIVLLSRYISLYPHHTAVPLESCFCNFWILAPLLFISDLIPPHSARPSVYPRLIHF